MPHGLLRFPHDIRMKGGITNDLSKGVFERKRSVVCAYSNSLENDRKNNLLKDNKQRYDPATLEIV